MQLFFHQHPGVQIVDVFPKSIAPFHKFKTTTHEIESFFATVKYSMKEMLYERNVIYEVRVIYEMLYMKVKYPFGPFCAVFSKGWRSAQ